MVKPLKYRLNVRLSARLKFFLIGGLIAGAIAVHGQGHFQAQLPTLLMSIKNLGWLAPATYIALFNLATVLCFPGSILTMMGGVLFGLFWGSLYVLIGAMFGAIFAFLAGRYLSRDWVGRQMGNYPKFQAIDEAVKKEGWKIVLLTRLSPIFPFNLLNFAFGITQVSLRDYIVGSMGIFPATVAYVYLGSLATDLTPGSIANPTLSRDAQLMQGLLQALGAIATVAVTVYTGRLAQKALNQRLVSIEETQSTGRNP